MFSGTTCGARGTGHPVVGFLVSSVLGSGACVFDSAEKLVGIGENAFTVCSIELNTMF